MVEDLEGAIEVMFFPSAYQLVAPHLHEDRIVLVKGRLDRREDVPKLIAMEMSLPDLDSAEQRAPSSSPCRRLDACRRSSTGSKRSSAAHPGTVEVHLPLQSGGRTTVMRLDDRLRVRPSPCPVW